jgi:hypothetical protein
MPLPTSRDINAVDGGPVPASVYNAIQDSIIALDLAVSALVVPTVNRTLFLPHTAGIATEFGTTRYHYLDGDDGWKNDIAAINQGVIFALPIPEGSTITEVAIFTSGGADKVGRLRRFVMATRSPTTVNAVGSISGTDVRTVIFSGSHAMVAGEGYDVEVLQQSNTTNQALGGCEVAYTLPS